MNARASTTIFLPLTGSMRARIEATIEGLTALLDEIDGDADFEPDSDSEPSLGWVGHGGDARGFVGTDDCELEDEYFEDDDPAEEDDEDEDDGTAEEDFRELYEEWVRERGR